jgi:hypothetical protein
MTAIYHILKNGVVQAVTVTTDQPEYFHNYSDFKRQADKGNPSPNSPFPPGNWRGGKTSSGKTGKR